MNKYSYITRIVVPKVWSIFSSRKIREIVALANNLVYFRIVISKVWSRFSSHKIRKIIALANNLVYFCVG